MIDTHCHLTYQPLYEQLDAVLQRAAAAGVDRMITVGTTPDDARQALALAQAHPHLFATVGVHPHYAMQCTDQPALQQVMRELAAHDKIVALGEMGLDLHYDDPPLTEQQRVFAWQLEIAASTDLPIIIHNREATDQTLAMIRASGLAGQRFVFHCFTGDRREHEAILAIGAMVSFTGIATFSSAREIAACAAATPLARLMIETDAPYLTPEPHRKVRPNEPQYVADIARFLAHQRDMPLDEFVQTMDANAQRFFRLPPV